MTKQKTWEGGKKTNPKHGSFRSQHTWEASVENILQYMTCWEIALLPVQFLIMVIIFSRLRSSGSGSGGPADIESNNSHLTGGNCNKKQQEKKGKTEKKKNTEEPRRKKDRRKRRNTAKRRNIHINHMKNGKKQEAKEPLTTYIFGWESAESLPLREIVQVYGVHANCHSKGIIDCSTCSYCQ